MITKEDTCYLSSEEQELLKHLLPAGTRILITPQTGDEKLKVFLKNPEAFKNYCLTTTVSDFEAKVRNKLFATLLAVWFLKDVREALDTQKPCDISRIFNVSLYLPKDAKEDIFLKKTEITREEICVSITDYFYVSTEYDTILLEAK